MQRSKVIWIVVSLVAAIAVGFTVGTKKNQEHSDAPIVHTYKMSFEQADNFKNMLNRLFSQQSAAPVASAQALSSGALIVRAPESMMVGLDEMIAHLEKQLPLDRKTIRLDYWVVLGEPAKTSNTSSLTAISTPLGAIDKLDGPRTYRILEHLSSSSISDHEVQINGSVARITAMAMTRTDNLLLRLEMRSRLGEVKSDTQGKPGEFIVLGQSALEPGISIGNQKVANGPANVYYIVRPEYVN